jgi:hypothetical protein
MADDTPTTGSSQVPATPVKTGRPSRPTWEYVVIYMGLGFSALWILAVIWESEKWTRLALPLAIMAVLIFRLRHMPREDRAIGTSSSPDRPG